jgi:hypothetical protein
MLKRAILTAIVAIAAISIAPRASKAQTDASDVHIKLVANAGFPVSGALVALISGDQVAAEGLSSATGTITLRATPGRYRIRVRRIGFRPYFSDSVTVPSSKQVDLKVETEKVVLDAMIVSASAQCGAITADAKTLSAVWDEIAKALRASQLTLADLNGIGYANTNKRQVGLRNELISNDTVLVPVGNSRPFGAVSPKALASLGYVRGNKLDGWEYFGPDEAVLLSNEFAATHCFKVVRDRLKRGGQIGVAFEPVPRRKQSDIKGVLWLDEKSAELRDVAFSFENAGIISKFESGGYTRFQRMPSGAWIVSDWQLRMPRIEIRMGRQEEYVLKGFYENGGAIVTVPPPAPSPSTSPDRSGMRH